MIFWLLAAFAAALWLVCLTWLPETHPLENRVPLSLDELATTYRRIGADRAFLPLAFAGTLNFNALFVYIASAPAFVLNILKLDSQHFAWLFIPAISGMMTGAFLSGRLAGKLSGTATVRLGYVIMLAASAINLAIALLLPEPRVPWSVLPVGLHAIGIGMNFPTLTLLLLDRFPHHRGAVSSVQAFVSLVISAILAGAISPIVSGSAMSLAITSALATTLGFLSWRVYRFVEQRESRGVARAAA
jgi:DHA1 family bicyclomycin/chloramphenicol resistance-like MFS transporter